MKREVKRYVLFVISLFFIGLGIALTKRGEIGISPVSSVANVLSLRYTALSFGTWTILSNGAFLLGQILILRRKFKPIQFLQIPLFFLCGIFTDFGVWITHFFHQTSYMAKVLFVLAGCIVLGFGIALGIIADVMLNAPEAFVKALSLVTNKAFGTIKVVCDICLVLLSAALSVVLFKGKLLGIGVGTVISAISVGGFVSVFCRILREPLRRILEPTGRM
ncbi:MAG: YitT family protein [Clostridia bacterium]|nr:YitT family protein [Clostridia bacterium]